MSTPREGEKYESTHGKLATEKDTPRDEDLYQSLADASHGCFTLDQVRLIRRVFDHADADKNGFVELHELEAMLCTIGDSVATRVMKEVIEHCDREDKESRWSFSSFVLMMRIRLSNDETLKLLTMEEDYIRSMGIDQEEQQAMEVFRKNRDVRRSSLGSQSNLKPNRLPKHHQHKPNDEVEYRHEFGILSEDEEGSSPLTGAPES